MKFLLLGVLAVQVYVASCFDNRTVVGFLQNNGFTTFLDLLNHAGLTAKLSGSGPFTVFAPTDAAFDKLPQTLRDSLKAVDTTALKNLLLFHVVNGVLIGPLFKDGMTVQSLDKEKDPSLIHIHKYDNGAVTAEGAQIIGGDNVLSNGIVHDISSVMFPAEISISEYLSKDESEFQDLFASLVLTNLEQTLAADGNYTIFAPNDQAFDKTQGGLVTLSSDIARFTEVLKYHVVPKVVYSAGLTDGMQLPTLHGTSLTIHINNGTDISVDNARVLRTDQTLTNGVLHVIDTVMNPFVTRPRLYHKKN